MLFKIFFSEIDRNLDELTGLKHEKLEIEKRLRRLKFEKSNNSNSNNVRKLATLIREKDLNSSDNESPDESDDGGTFFLLTKISFHLINYNMVFFQIQCYTKNLPLLGKNIE